MVPLKLRVTLEKLKKMGLQLKRSRKQSLKKIVGEGYRLFFLFLAWNPKFEIRKEKSNLILDDSHFLGKLIGRGQLDNKCNIIRSLCQIPQSHYCTLLLSCHHLPLNYFMN